MSLNSTTFDVLKRQALAASTAEESIDLLLDLRTLKDQVKALSRLVEEVIVERIEELGELVFVEEPGKVSPADTRWYVGPVKEVKPRHPEPAAQAALVEDLMAAVGGDMLAFAELLASGWAKQGAVAAIDGELWDRHFERRDRAVLKDGKPTKVQRLQEVRMMFAGSRP